MISEGGGYSFAGSRTFHFFAAYNKQFFCVHTEDKHCFLHIPKTNNFVPINKNVFDGSAIRVHSKQNKPMSVDSDQEQEVTEL